MACCKCCCGNANCTEGQQGKCCCGGPSGVCCQTGEYCCSGACQSEPCGCSGSCDEETPCPEGCECVDGQCVAVGCCCVNGQIQEGHTEETCEECGTTNTCFEQTFSEDPEASCPEGWDRYATEWGVYCSRTTNPASCDDCSGNCSSWQTGACGTWYPDCSVATKYYISVTHNPYWSCAERCGQWFMGSGFCEGPDGVLTWGYEANPWEVTTACNYTGQKGYFDTAAECEAAYAARIASGPLANMNVNCVWPPCPGNGCVGTCIDTNNPLP